MAVITGSGRGVGRALALMMAEQGASVVVSDKDQEPAEQVVGLINKNGGTAIGYRYHFSHTDHRYQGHLCEAWFKG